MSPHPQPWGRPTPSHVVHPGSDCFPGDTFLGSFEHHQPQPGKKPSLEIGHRRSSEQERECSSSSQPGLEHCPSEGRPSFSPSSLSFISGPKCFGSEPGTEVFTLHLFLPVTVSPPLPLSCSFIKGFSDRKMERHSLQSSYSLSGASFLSLPHEMTEWHGKSLPCVQRENA